ncbi:Zn-ribbon domain-containing OB-fold protein [Natrinema salsiterrestre]|uniref:Zn-ribbon domain-containing OB-fold protein n=1 Tax=Natrinema salsiterrestre TaxID=2950540 RepID=A0A9Q4Q0P3_9EURY|nr:Zn-ribbon domain-containing OB-fold protein [Natrinema salsiterrestre]MDF9746219.1 Zn-ribbon domain-containing OB-fold protein [Natrinema salsiterrestre]
MEPYTRPFWESLRDGTVLIHACESCDERFFPPSPICPHCHSTDVDWAETTGRGTLYSFTRTHATATAFDDELVIGLVELADGPKLLAPIDASYDALEIGDDVRIEAAEYDVEHDRGWLEGYPFFAARPLD